MIPDPQQELFTRIKLNIEALGYDVYDGFLPPEGTPYPFVYMGDSTQIDDPNKSAVFGNVHQTIHVWSNTPRNRGTVSTMLYNIKNVCRKIEHTQCFAWNLLYITQRILQDDTTKTPLLHAIIETEFKLMGGKYNEQN